MDQAIEIEQQRITEILLDDLHESPFNPRKHFDDIDLQELAEDIKSHGRILQPLLVRPRVPELFAHTNDPAAVVDYELVFGHRRLRAARLAGLTHAPCMVHVMTDLQVKRAQISENLQRKDVHPIEEAEGFQALIDEHGETADTIAMSLGGPNKRSYVYSRLKLLDASHDIRKACAAGEIGSEVALLVARLRVPKLQERALSYIRGKFLHLDDGGKHSHRQIRDLLNEHFTLDLKSAPFPIEEEMLVPAAGNCVRCHKRSANAPEYADIAEKQKVENWSRNNYGADVCTDPDCFAEKKVVFFKRQADELRAKGKEVVDGNKARIAIDARGNVKGAYIALKDVKTDLAKVKAERLKKGLLPPQVVVIQDPRSGKTVEAVLAKDVKAAAVEAKPSSSSQHKSTADWEKERKEREARGQANTHFRKRLLLQVRERTSDAPLGIEDLRMVTQYAFDSSWGSDDGDVLCELWGTQHMRDIDKLIPAMGAADLTRLLLDCALVENLVDDGHDGSDQPEALFDAAQRLGLETEPAAEKPAPTPTPAAQAAKGAAAKEKKEAASTPSTAGAGAKKGKSLRELLADRAKLTGQADLLANDDETAGPAGQEVKVDAGVTAGGGVAQPEAIEETGA